MTRQEDKYWQPFVLCFSVKGDNNELSDICFLSVDYSSGDASPTKSSFYSRSSWMQRQSKTNSSMPRNSEPVKRSFCHWIFHLYLSIVFSCAVKNAKFRKHSHLSLTTWTVQSISLILSSSYLINLNFPVGIFPSFLLLCSLIKQDGRRKLVHSISSRRKELETRNRLEDQTCHKEATFSSENLMIWTH